MTVWVQLIPDFASRSRIISSLRGNVSNGCVARFWLALLLAVVPTAHHEEKNNKERDQQKIYHDPGDPPDLLISFMGGH